MTLTMSSVAGNFPRALRLYDIRGRLGTFLTMIRDDNVRIPHSESTTSTRRTNSYRTKQCSIMRKTSLLLGANSTLIRSQQLKRVRNYTIIRKTSLLEANTISTTEKGA